MKKQEFLDELKRHLKVLQDEEQEDIIDEYSQHIEMKIANGLSEEEAIKDFGPIHALAGEILEAYHVKPEYEQENQKKMIRQTTCSDSIVEEQEGNSRLKGRLQQVWMFFKRVGRNGSHLAGVCIGRMLWFLAMPFRKGKQLWARWRINQQEADEEAAWAEIEENENAAENAGLRNGVEIDRILIEEGIQQTEEKLTDTSGVKPLRRAVRWKARGEKRSRWLLVISGACKQNGRAIFRGIYRMIRWSVTAGLWCCRIAWNCCVLLASACSICAGLVFLFLLGTLAVLWAQGYPLAGVVLGCLGAVLCFSSLAVLSCTFFWRKHHE